MKDLLKHVRSVNNSQHLWSRFDRLLIGVSGGSDSMCLLDLMVQCAQRDSLILIVAHVNYGLRGAASDKDEALVKVQCARYDIPFYVKKVNVTDGKESEALWRKQRYAYFEELRHAQNIDHIVLGHNTNDQAETLLLHLLRGSGLNGLRGMQYHRDVMIRPLLQLEKDQIITYCRMHNISYREDVTNDDVTFKRNQIRHELLPFLREKYNNQIVRSLAVTANQVAIDYDYIASMALESLPIKKDDFSVSFSAQTYHMCHQAVRNMRLHQVITSLQGDTINMTSRNIAELHKAIMSTKNKHQIVKIQGLKMERKGDTVRLTIAS